MAVTIYHNPRCSKSRQALALLREQGVEPRIVEYLRTPPDAETLKGLLERLELAPRELMRRKEAPYKELDLDNRGLEDAALIQAMVDNPILIERPIVLKGEKAVVARPPEKALEIL
ncbi:arsenate reductase (glutaredoxin) [Fodinicurvata sediminis]|uniref:arsenate reductase (glutaredoxin) n=1 Tax=Fodinicurvata sediminis TaxID=1121832 RepID=UPI0003B77155|nr:arsenate reductase (glutaredoxin) [Fodinicurvata sediminis]